MNSIDINKPLTAETWRDLLQRVADLEDRLPAREQEAEAKCKTCDGLRVVYDVSGPLTKPVQEVPCPACRTPPASVKELVEEALAVVSAYEVGEDLRPFIANLRAALSRATEGGK